MYLRTVTLEKRFDKVYPLLVIFVVYYVIGATKDYTSVALL